MQHPSDDILAHLASRSARHDTNVEFLVAEFTPRPSLYVVRRGHIDKALHRQAWAGDHAAFSRFQAASHKLAEGGSAGGSQFVSLLARALGEVVEDGNVLSVDGFVVTAYTQADGFRYLPNASLATGTVNPQVIPAGGGPVAWAQGPHDGSYTQVLAVPVSPGIGALGVWVREWSSRLFHWPLGLDDSVIFDARTSRGFIEEVRQEFGIRLQAAVSL